MTAFSHLRTRRRLALLVLPALLLRALIPVGFMPMAGSGGMSLALCPGATLEPVMAHAGHAGPGAQHAHHHGGVSDSGTAHHTPCLFSAGASAGFAAPLAAAALGTPALTAPVERFAHQASVPAIRRAQVPRAPPAALT